MSKINNSYNAIDQLINMELDIVYIKGKILNNEYTCKTKVLYGIDGQWLYISFKWDNLNEYYDVYTTKTLLDTLYRKTKKETIDTIVSFIENRIKEMVNQNFVIDWRG